MAWNPYQSQQSQTSQQPHRKQSPFRFNIDGIIGLVAIGLMVGVAFLQHWDIDWLYFVIAIVAYSAVIITSSIEEDFITDIRLKIGCHLAFLLLAGGLWINVGGFFIQIGIFVAAVAAGLAIPFLLVRKR